MGSSIANDAEVQNAEQPTGPVPPEAGGPPSSPGTATEAPRDGERDAFEVRKAEWRAQYEIATPEQEWLLEQMVLYAIRLDRCRAREAAILRHEQQLARLRWDEERRAETEELGARLARRPDLIARRLRQTRQGAEWLLERWRLLGRLLEGDGQWTRAQVSMALDLIGTPRALRPKVPVVADPADLVARQIDELERQKARSLDALDEHQRQAAGRGVPIATPSALVELRREEDALNRKFLWARRHLHPKARARPKDAMPSEATTAKGRTRSGPARAATALPEPDQARKWPARPSHMSDEEWRLYQARLAYEARRRWNTAP